MIIDFVGYESLVDYLDRHALYKLNGDIIEIGAFVGGGTVKLAEFARKYGKKVFVVDVFNPATDATATPDGIKMSDIYIAFLAGQSQYQAYLENTGAYNNIVTIRQDSMTVDFPPDQEFLFGFIDGNHQSDYVRNDFLLVWKHLVPGGAVALHDYKTELPGVTRTIDEILVEKKSEIADTVEIDEKHIILVTRK